MTSFFRAARFFKLFASTWRWLWTAPFALLSALQAIREEVLLPEDAEKYRYLRLLPDIDWKWYLVMFLGMAVVVFFEAAFRAIRSREQTMHSLHQGLVTMDHQLLGALQVIPYVEINHKDRSKTCDVRLVFCLTSTFPLNYMINFAEISIDGQPAGDVPPDVKRHGTIVPGEGRNFSWAESRNVLWNKSRTWTGKAKYQIQYAPLGAQVFRYFLNREVDLEIREGILTERLHHDDRGAFSGN